MIECLLVGVETLGSDACYGEMQLHHLITQQRLRHNHLPTDDSRIMVPVCARHHESVSNGSIKIPWAKIPAQALEFADEFDILWSLERDHP